MTREEEIRKAADKFQREFIPKDKNNERFCFIAGALWSDSHPIDIDVVMLCKKIQCLEREVNYLENELRSQESEMYRLKGVNNCLRGYINKQWISVEDNSIPIGRLFLALFEDGDLCLCIKYIADDGKFYVVAGQFKEDESKITHWMDIPQLPRKEE